MFHSDHLVTNKHEEICCETGLKDFPCDADKWAAANYWDLFFLFLIF